MFKRKKEKEKRLTALLLAAALVFNNVSFVNLVYAAGGTDISWTQDALDAAAVKDYIPTGLSYRTSTSGIKPDYAAFGEKQYLYGSGAYSEYADRLIYCVNMHKPNGGTLLWNAQAFLGKKYDRYHLPTEYIKGSEDENVRIFNFLMMVYATSYQAEQEPNSLHWGNANVGVDVLTVCVQLTQGASDYTVFTGNWDEDLAWFKSTAYPAALDAVGPTNTLGDSTTYKQLTSTAGIPQWVKDKGCTNRAQAIFCYVWTAADLTRRLDVEGDVDTWRLEAVLEEDGLYHVRIPFDGENQAIVEYLRILNAECYGDWQRMDDAAGLHFASPSGQMPSEGSIAKLAYADSDSMIARSMAKAKLQEIKFFCKSDKVDISKPGSFDYIQTYFTSIMDEPLEIYLRLGSTPSGGGTDVEVQRYEHEELWNADYNVNLIKYDSETGKPLEGAHFDILEAFDDSQLDSTSLDLRSANGGASIGSLNSTSWGDDDIGSNYDGDTGLLQTDALLYNWANDEGSQFETWGDPDNDPCRQDDDLTDASGRLTYPDGVGKPSGKPAHYDTRDYSYHKGYCGGHPAPTPEYEELPEEDGEGEDDEDAAAEVEAYNQALHDEAWAAWYAEVTACGDLAAEGGFFHAIDPDVAQAAMEADRDQFYEDFIALTYDYSAKEIASRKGYILHDLHGDDVEIEWRTVTSSQYKDFTQNGISHLSGGTGGGGADTYILPPEQTEITDSMGVIDSIEATDSSETITVQDSTGEPEAAGFRFEDEGYREIRKEQKRAEEETGTNAAASIDADTKAEAVTDTEEMPSEPDFLFIDEDSGYTSASPSELGEATPAEMATPAEAIRRKITFTGFMAEVKSLREQGRELLADLFSLDRADTKAGGTRDSVSFLPSEASQVDQGDKDTVDWTFILYDHRTEGEVHINKRDLDLDQGANAGYDSYGDTQGDSALEGAVYGLFAASDITHPDGKSGVIFQKDNLVSVATTDKNGDASFLAITEAPGTVFSYRTGQMEPTGFTAAGNLHRSQTEADRIRDNEAFTGHNSDGGSLSLTDSRAGTATGYQKLTSNQGVDGTGDASGYPVLNNEGNNGNCWIGRPLIISQEGSRYYVMELARSEGYELSRYGVDADVTNREADAAGALPSAEGSVSVSELTQNRPGQYNQFSVTSKGTTNGYDIIVSGLMDGASFHTTRTETIVNPGGTHTELLPVQEPVYGTKGSPVVIGGKQLEAVVGQRISLPNGSTATVSQVSSPTQLKTGVRPGNAFQVEPPEIAGEDKAALKADFIKKVNEGLKKAGYKTPGEDSPWLKVSLSGTTEKTWCESLTGVLKDYRVFNAFSVADVVTEGGRSYALLRYSYLQAGTALPSVYDETSKSIWVKKPISYSLPGKTVDGYLYVPYPDGAYDDVVKNAAGFVTSATVKQQSLSKSTASWGEDLSLLTLKDEVGRTWWVYGDREQAYDNNGNLVYNTRYDSVEVAPGYEEKVTDTPLAGTYDTAGQIYTVHIDPSVIPADGKLDIRIKYAEEYVNGTTQPYTQYVQANAVISAVPSSAAHASYIVDVLLTWPGQKNLYQDAGTRANPLRVVERAIRQKVKIVKDLQTTPEGSYAHNTNAESGHEDAFTTGPGGTEDAATKLPNFRFKIYLKSNLERLYRDNDGTVAWLDRDGREIDVTGYQAAYPETEPFGNVQKLYTKVFHKLDSKTTGSISNNVSDAAITANSELYSYGADGLIAADQNPGYTRLLETVMKTVEDGAGKTRQVKGYNYEKFFDAVQTVNYDKWDRNDDKSTSFKPFPYIRELIFGKGGGEKADPAEHNNAKTDNQANTSDTARDNALRSDSVRQFAITWYLDSEVEKLQEDNGSGESQPDGGSESYQEEVYDKALRQAIIKAENYLKPFFTHDLDELYAVRWDSEADGGSDLDKTTLSADTFYPTTGNGAETSKDGYYYGVSKYLPYGAYVTVEQQPYNRDLGDFYNKHYKTDRPKEIVLPAVYAPGGSEASPETLNAAYEYHSSDTPETLQKNFHIRFNEEWSETHTDDLRKYVIRAHNTDGDFEVYKYGLEPDKLAGTITYGGGTYGYAGFTMTQEEADPYKDMYEAENAASDYKSNQTVETYYHYGSISEDAGVSDDVLYQHGPDRDDNNLSGTYFKDGVKTVTGALTAYDGLYAAALVPWTVTEPADAGAYAPEQFSGYADGKFRNTFYTSKLRIEKLDSETGEAILHDGAVFTIYSAKREDSENSDGNVQFYNQDTVIEGSKEFLEAMGARDITPFARAALPWETPYYGKYYGTVSAGTPVCEEKEQIVMKDEQGAKTGTFKAFTTTGDLSMGAADNPGQKSYADQNTGYLTTPQPLGAGCYVLAEIKAPAGYVRSKPVAVELYSDEVAYYLNGDKDSRVIAAIYEDNITKTPDNGGDITNPDGTKPNGNKPQDIGDTARVYFNNTPIRLEVSKVKSSETMVSYELNGRLEGSITQLKVEYGLENLELAYNASGKYSGYGWKKGFLDSLKQKQAAGESIEILYEDGIFTGKARLFKVLETSDDVNRYLPGATMTLYDAVEVTLSGDSEDYRYAGVNVERDRYGNVTNIYVQKGYAGNALKYVLDKTGPDGINDETYKNYNYDQQEDDKGAGTWLCQTVEREDTDILFYDLGGLDVLTEEKGILYSHDRAGRRIQAKNGASIYALKNGAPFLEIVSGDYENLKYSSKDRRFAKAPEGTKFYHLDSDKNRDSETEPYTGMAFVTEEATGKLLTWPVKISRDQYGNVIAREKIKTSRIAAIEADTENEYTIGTCDSLANSLKKHMNPVLNAHGQPVYYQVSGELYKKGKAIYDRDGDYVRYQYSDSLKSFNDNAYRVNESDSLKNIGSNPEADTDDAPLYHRQGEACLIENTWTTGERTPNDPFQTEMTAGQADVLKRVAAGTYIMEELKAPDGYVKTMPVGLTVSDGLKVQTARATDNTINGYIEKLDAPAAYGVKILDRDSVLTEAQSSMRTEGKGGYTYQNVAGAELALFKARRVSTTDLTAHPSGYYLVKTEQTPAQWNVLDNQNQKVLFTASWTAGAEPEYLEAIPKGYYILEEISTPSGYLPASMEIEIKEAEGLQYFTLPNDHTKVEIFKYMEQGNQKTALPNEYRAELALYEAVTDADGIVMEDGVPGYQADKQADSWQTDDCTGYEDFMKEYQELYKAYQTGFEHFTWNDGKKEVTADRISSEATDKNESVRQRWKTAEGKEIYVQVTGNLLGTGSYGFDYDFKFNYRELAGNTVSYDTPEGNHRIDYLPFNGHTPSGEQKGYYVLVETGTPAGFAAAKPKAIIVDEVPDIQLYALKNEPKFLHIEKVEENGRVLKGAELALYRAADDGSLVMDAAHLFDRWISGSEGVYSQEDADKKEIPEGFSVGDMKPHRISPVAYGTYYLAELAAPAGYVKMQPVKLIVTADSETLIKAVNIPKKGIIIIEKTDSEDGQQETGLAGAVFEIANRSTKEKFYMVTDDKGQAASAPMTIGTSGEDGALIPYIFTIHEILPPDGYEINPFYQSFSFADDGSSETLYYRYSARDEQTEIFISKSDFNSNSILKGAKLAVYNTKEEDGSYKASGEPIEEWTSDGTRHLIKGKLSAGKIYMLKELEAPQGYGLSEPVIFTISDDGRKIVNVSNGRNKIEFKASDSFEGAVEAVTVRGRQAERMEITLTNLSDEGAPDINCSPGRLLSESDGLREGALYEQRATTCFTDGNKLLTSRDIFWMEFDKDENYRVTEKFPENTELVMETDLGTPIDRWIVENADRLGYAHTIFNPEYENRQNLEVSGENGRFGGAVMPGDIVRYEIRYQNLSDKADHLMITVQLDDQTDYMPANSTKGGLVTGNYITWMIPDAAPGESGRINLTAAVRPEAEKQAVCKVTIGQRTGSQSLEMSNPIGRTGSLTIAAHVSGTDGNVYKKEQFSYRIYLKNAEGMPLKGRCFYSGSYSGTIKDGESILLRGDEFITLEGLPLGTEYRIEREKPEGIDLASVKPVNTEGSIQVRAASALFLCRKNDSTIREVFKKGDTFRLVETVYYSDGSSLISDKLTFSLDENASVDHVELTDRPAETVISKIAAASGEELSGAHLAVRDQKEKFLEEWVTSGRPHKLSALLEPGETYILEEILPPEGYAFSKAIPFTVIVDGVSSSVQMRDKKTQAEIIKTDEEGREGLSGAFLEIWDEEERLVDSWLSDGREHRLSGVLKAGAVYTLKEVKPPAGYYCSPPVKFKVPEDGSLIKVFLKNEKISAELVKRGISADEKEEYGMIGGALITIYSREGQEIYRFVTETGRAHRLPAILKAGETYRAEELKVPEGYMLSEPVWFTVPWEPGEKLTILMTDKKMPDKPDRDSPGGADEEEPREPELSVGRITAEYTRILTGEGRIPLEKLIKLPVTGDFYDNPEAKGVWCLLTFCVCLFLWKKYRR